MRKKKVKTETSNADSHSALIKEMSEEVLASERLARAILEQTGEAIVVCDVRGVITRANLAAHKLCGANPLFQTFDQIFTIQTSCGQLLNLNEDLFQLMDGSIRKLEGSFKSAEGM